MELTWLRTFVDAAETLNFRQTSERLLMSQPNVTVHIRLLEDNIGVLLFKRERNRVSLTEEGKLFKPEAESILKKVEAGVSRLQAYAQGYRTAWTLAISPLMAETILPYVLKAFTDDHPDLELTIRVEESAYIEELIDAGEVSAGISALPPTKRKMQHQRLYDDPLLFIVPQSAYDEESGPAWEVDELLSTYYLFTGHHPLFWDELLPKLRSAVPRIRTLQVTQAHIAKRFIQDGLGVSFLPASMVRRELIEGKLLDAHFSLFSLPKVSTYMLTKEFGPLETELIDRIQAVHFG